MIRSLILILAICCNAYTQNATAQDFSSTKKGDFYFYWGYNLDWYSKSDISFTGDGYDFMLKDVVAKDRQSKFKLDPYFKLNKLTIPQYNMRLGYFISDKYSITLGWDHMKYVMAQGQTVKINGTINNVDTLYNGEYTDKDIKLTPEFLTFEHTDGLNYANAELRRYDHLLHKNKVDISAVSGIGMGFIYPRTNVSLMNIGRADQWHYSGYGASAVIGANATFYKHYFIQTELKGGYINMPDILTTYRKEDRAKQSFFFSQWNVVFGARFNILKSSSDGPK
ncbi:hypothetical protein N8368_03020 [Bacteroidia bacterium]|nr:hypothetical protein [Bacteroidia bacterium]MDB9882583.1 hypothetical protein [Bacteroidia bacterium]MDC1395460.1 hypothetical protein [Bacteroidia bacterium]